MNPSPDQFCKGPTRQAVLFGVRPAVHLDQAGTEKKFASFRRSKLARQPAPHKEGKAAKHGSFEDVAATFASLVFGWPRRFYLALCPGRWKRGAGSPARILESRASWTETSWGGNPCCH